MLTSSCCALLAQIASLNVAFPGSSSYNSTQVSYWSTQEASISPSCIVKPQDTADVARILSILPQHQCKFAIKSQGHAPTAGFANIDHGVTIDMTSIKQVSLSRDSQVAHVGTGATWFDVYNYLDQHHVTVAGGRNGNVGVGGLTIGGGISYIGPRVGWACDNVINWEVVLASGEVVNANKTSHPDLWRALKGGGNNFGVVTRIDFQTFPQGEILAGFITNPFSERKAVYQAFAGLANSPHYDPYAEMVTAFSWDQTTGWGNVLNLAAYTKPDTKPAALRSFVDIPGTNNTLNITLTSTWANETPFPITEQQFLTGTYGVSAELICKMIDRWGSMLEAVGPLPGNPSWGFAFEPLPTVFTQYGPKNGGNSMGTSPADGNAMVVLMGPSWNDSKADAQIMAIADHLLAAGNEIAREMDMLLPFEYLNYAGPPQQPLKSYGAANYAQLQATSRKYDPRGVFQTLVPGGFKFD